jgi:uncharacterized membrane protein
MTDLPPPNVPPSVPTPTPRSGRGVKIVLAISVALNLAVAGLVLGAWASDHGPRKGMPRDLGFGPFSEALSPEDRRALRKAFMDQAPDFRTTREAARAEFVTLLATLRATPFDPAALTAALTAIETRNANRLDLGRTLIEARLVQMSEADRLAFADRLEQGLRGKGPKD